MNFDNVALHVVEVVHVTTGLPYQDALNQLASCAPVTLANTWRGGDLAQCLVELCHLKEAPKNPAERRHRRDNEHLDASAGVDGIEAFYEQCVGSGATILKPLTATAWATKDFYIEDPDGYMICFGGRPRQANIAFS